MEVQIESLKTGKRVQTAGMNPTVTNPTAAKILEWLRLLSPQEARRLGWGMSRIEEDQQLERAIQILDEFTPAYFRGLAGLGVKVREAFAAAATVPVQSTQSDEVRPADNTAFGQRVTDLTRSALEKFGRARNDFESFPDFR